MWRLAVLMALCLLITPSQGHAQDSSVQLARDAWVAVETDQLESLKKAVAKGADLRALVHDGQNLVARAAVRASPAMLRYLAQAGLDIDRADEHGYTPIMRALQAARVDNALVLRRELGASLEGVTSDGYTVRVLAETVGLDDFGPEPPGQNALFAKETANKILLRAVEQGDIESVRLALVNHAEISAKAPNGWTALMIAALAGQAEIVSLLAERGAIGQPLQKVDGKVDAVVATLVGKGNGRPHAVEAVLNVIANHTDLGADNDLYRQIATRQGYTPDFINRYFPENDLPILEFELPRIASNEHASWTSLQKALSDKGLYKEKVDGIPGAGTVSALIGYLVPLEERLVRRAVTAMRRAQNVKATFNRPSVRGYGTFAQRSGRAFGQVRITKAGVIGAGYFGIQEHSTRASFGYFDPTVASDEPLILVSQWIDDKGLTARSLELWIAGGRFTVTRGPKTTRAAFYSSLGDSRFSFNFTETNMPLPLEPLPNADLLEEIVEASPSPPSTIIEVTE